MWNSKKSVLLTLIATRTLMVIFIILVFSAPFLFKWYCDVMGDCNQTQYIAVLVTFYACCPCAAVTLFEINRFLGFCKSGDIFTRKTVKNLRIISWACFAAVPLSLPLCYFIFEALPIPFAAGFIGLMLRVIKNIFESAVEIKEENDLTI